MEEFWSRKFEEVIQGKMPLRLSRIKVRKFDLPSRVAPRTILLVRINVMGE